MKTNRPRTNWLIDAVLFAGFIASFFLDLTGVAWHQWLGVAIGALAVYHFLAHQQWVSAVTRRLFGRTSKQARLYYIVDTGLMGGFVSILATGLAISTWADLPLEDYAAWRDAHVTVSIITLALVVTKIAIHWRWIVDVARRSISKPNLPTDRPRVARPASIAGRREFLKLMGLVNLAAAFALSRVLSADQDSAASVAAAVQNDRSTFEPILTFEPSPTSPAPDGATVPSPALVPAPAATDTLTVEATATATVTTVPTAEPSTTAMPTTTATAATPTATTALTPTSVAVVAEEAASSCVVRCRRGCSYPGRCRRYVDANNNNRCDLGECL